MTLPPCAVPCSPDAWLRTFVAAVGAESHQPVQYRPAAARLYPTASRIPRRILMTSHDAAHTMKKNGKYIRTWWTLNPEFEWLLLDEGACSDFVRRFCSRLERLAYFRALFGSQRADLFRVYWLRTFGGVYADTDVELRK